MIDRKLLTEALSEAFTDIASFKRLLQDGLSRNWASFAGTETPLEDGISNTVEKAIAENWLPALVQAVERSDSRNNPKFRAFIAAHPSLDGGLPSREQELAYLEALIHDIETWAERFSPLRAVRKTRVKRPLLEALEREGAIAVLLKHRRHARNKAAQLEQPAETRDYDNVLAAYQDAAPFVLLGAPGSGKSTTLGQLALRLARDAQSDPEAPIPILAPLGYWTGEETLEEFIAARPLQAGGTIDSLSQASRLVLLLDGLNEVPTAAHAEKATAVRELVDRLRGRKTPVIVSCRDGDYTGDLDLGLDTVTLEPLSPQRVQEVLRHWFSSGGESAAEADRLFWQLAGDEGLSVVLERLLAAGGSEESFWFPAKAKEQDWEFVLKVGWDNYRLWQRHLGSPRNLVHLAANPFMLFMLYAVWLEEDGRLPANRGELFAQFVDQLLAREHIAGTPEGGRLLTGLAVLAWEMQRSGAGRNEALVVVSAETARALLGGEALLKHALGGTLLEGDREIRFRHQLLQEYFAAQALHSRLGKMPASELWPREAWWNRSGWEVTAVLLAGYHAADCSRVIGWLADAQPEVAAQCIVESGADIENRPEVLESLRSRWLPRMIDVQAEPSPEARAALGRALGRLGLDDRKGVGVSNGVPEIDWVRIPGGKFRYQEERKPREIEAFHIARYPVTNVQFRAFLQAADGYRDDRWWEGLTDPDRTPGEPEWSEDNHPRETVSWFEAMAFCAWLSRRLEYEVRLPTEWEWERAARGTDGREYPWGNEYKPGYANIDETMEQVGPYYLRRTSAVGVYPQGASPEGVLDLTGNVWEWCLNEHGKPKRTQRDGGEPRVLRGGSWFDFQVYARVGSRSWNSPYYRFNYFGFRVVCSSPIR